MIDLRREPDELLLRVLLAADAPVAVIVRNNHADIVDERSQRALLDLVEPWSTVRFHRSTPDSSTAIVTAQRRPTRRPRCQRRRSSPMFPVTGWRRRVASDRRANARRWVMHGQRPRACGAFGTGADRHPDRLARRTVMGAATAPVAVVITDTVLSPALAT